MTEAKKKIQVSIEEGAIAEVTINGTKVAAVSADGKKITAYTNDAVETKVSAEAGASISIVKNFNAVVLNGVSIEQAADGHLIIAASCGSTIDTLPPAIGDTMVDGTIYVGVSPDTNQPLYAAPADAPAYMNFDAAAAYAKSLDVGGKKDFRIPSRAELNVLFQIRETGGLKGTFNLTGLYPKGCYWSSTFRKPYFSDDPVTCAYEQELKDGERGFDFQENNLSVRCVRGGSVPSAIV